MGNAARVAEPFQAGLAALADHPLVGEVRGTGLIAGVELVADKPSRRSFEPAGKITAKAVALAHEEGLIARNIGETVALCPPMILTEADAAEIVARLSRALDRTEAWVRETGMS